MRKDDTEDYQVYPYSRAWGQMSTVATIKKVAVKTLDRLNSIERSLTEEEQVAKFYAIQALKLEDDCMVE